MADAGVDKQEGPRVRLAWLSHDQLELLIAVGLGVAAVLPAGAPLAEVNWNTIYASGPAGYTDYPALELVAD